MIRDAGLDPAEILEGITLGLDASLPDLIEAISSVIQGLIEAANEELGIESPSQVFWEMGQQSMAGFMRGMLDATGAMTDVMGDVVGPSAYTSTPAVTEEGATVNVYFGDTVLNDQMDVALFEDRIQSIVADAIYK